jgi:hypothetical protein
MIKEDEKEKQENLEEICYWKTYGTENIICGFYCLECSGKPEENCVDYRNPKDDYEE